MTPDRRVRADMIRYSRRVWERGWVANHDGNLTALLRPERVLCTPTSFSKVEITDNDLLCVDRGGSRTHGHTRPFSELVLHLAIYEARPDVKAVIHAHPPFASAMACAGQGLDTPFMPEAVVSLGDRVPLVPFAAPKTPAFTSVLEPYMPYFDALLLENHGVIAYGDSLEQAYLRLELVEHLAQIATHALPWGGVRALSADVVEALLSARTRAGLGPGSRGLPNHGPRRVEPVHRDTSDRASGDGIGGVSTAKLSKVIAEELAALARSS